MISSWGSNFNVAPIARETRHNFSARLRRSRARSRSSAEAIFRFGRTTIWLKVQPDSALRTVPLASTCKSVKLNSAEPGNRAQGRGVTTGDGGQQKLLGSPAAFQASEFRGRGEVDRIGSRIRLRQPRAPGSPPGCDSICMLVTHDRVCLLGKACGVRCVVCVFHGVW